MDDIKFPSVALPELRRKIKQQKATIAELRRMVRERDDAYLKLKAEYTALKAAREGKKEKSA